MWRNESIARGSGWKRGCVLFYGEAGGRGLLSSLTTEAENEFVSSRSSWEFTYNFKSVVVCPIAPRVPELSMPSSIV